MSVKAIEVAKALGISKATVSLALNNKPGVSEDTRLAVLRCRDELETKRAESISSIQQIPSSPKMIKILLFERNLNIVADPLINLLTNTLRRFDEEARRGGYAISIAYVGCNPSEVKTAVDECNGPGIAGVILFATEMHRSEFKLFRSIQVPMVVYDNEFGSQYNSVVADNEDIVTQQVTRLAEAGYRHMHYLATSVHLYNFLRRRVGYLAGLYVNGMDRAKCSIIEIGETIEESETLMKQWLLSHQLPEVFITENYRLTIGAFNALNSLGIRVPDQVGILGIDEVSPLLTHGVQISHIRIDHIDRVQVAVQLLIQEIEHKSAITSKMKISTRSVYVPGKSLKEENEP